MIAILALFATGFAPSQSSEAVLLRRNFVVGEIDTYSESSTYSSVSGEPPEDSRFEKKTARKVTIRTKEFDKVNNLATVEFKYFDIVEKSGDDLPSGGPKEYSMFALLNSRNQATSVKSEGLADSSRKTLENSMLNLLSSFQFPENSVKIGDTWQVKYPTTTETFDGEQSLQGKLTKISDIKGKKIAEVVVSGKVDTASTIRFSVADSVNQPPPMRMVGVSENVLVFEFEVVSGKLISLKNSNVSDLNMEMPNGEKSPTKSRFVSELRLDSPK